MSRSGCLCVLLWLAGCASPRIRAMVPGSGARIAAEGDELLRIARTIEIYEPAVIEILGTRWEGRYRVEVSDDVPPVKVVGYTLSWTPLIPGLGWSRKRVVLCPGARGEHIEEVLVHELVHVHARGPWVKLPPVVFEGLADWIVIILAGQTEEFRKPPPDPAVLRRVLAMTNDEWLALDDRSELVPAALWIGSHLLPPPRAADPGDAAAP